MLPFDAAQGACLFENRFQFMTGFKVRIFEDDKGLTGKQMPDAILVGLEYGCKLPCNPFYFRVGGDLPTENDAIFHPAAVIFESDFGLNAEFWLQRAISDKYAMTLAALFAPKARFDDDYN